MPSPNANAPSHSIPDFGNPYNDIGAYMIELGQFDEAIPWLQQAIEAPRYEPRHFPHYNLGRAYLGKEMYGQAIALFSGSPQCRARIHVSPPGLSLPPPPGQLVFSPRFSVLSPSRRFL